MYYTNVLHYVNIITANESTNDGWLTKKHDAQKEKECIENDEARKNGRICEQIWISKNNSLFVILIYVNISVTPQF